MKTKNIIVKLKSSDTTQFVNPGGENNFMIQLDQTDLNKMVKANLMRDLEKFNLVPNNTIYDLVHFALGIYTIDQVVSRQLNGFQGWSRHLVVDFPVHDPQLWNNVSDDFATYLSFLSGDKWEFVFRQNHETRDFELACLPSRNFPKTQQLTVCSCMKLVGQAYYPGLEMLQFAV
mgnify:CR=1 FL=1